ncbi:MAG: DUF2948 family protein [Caulobacterales bacterium]|uniref:DUF2948 family protein n=1 Tax=Glycocaulis sp. TaxID=1969725 RepID=UPI003F9EC9A2
MSSKPLRLIGEDAGDIAPVSAALQDAIARMGDLTFEARARRFTAVFSRYRWEASRGQGERVRSALQVGSVLSVKAMRLRKGAPDAFVSLLSLAFEPSGEAENPAGTLVLTFAGGGALRLEVECVDLVLADVSAPWKASARPDHGADDDAGAPA